MKRSLSLLTAAIWILLLCGPVLLMSQQVRQYINGGNGYFWLNGSNNFFGITAATSGEDAILRISGKPDDLNGDARLWLTRSNNDLSATLNFDLLRPTQTLILRATSQWGLGLEGNNHFTLFRRFQEFAGSPVTTKGIMTVNDQSPYTVMIGEPTTPIPGSIFVVQDFAGTGSNGIARFRDGGISQMVVYDAAQSYQMIVYGDALATGTWSTSDKKLKRQISSLSMAMEQLKKLQPRTYQFRKEKQFQHLGLPDEQQFGLVAQELEEVFPNLVRTTEVLNETSGEPESIKAINYTGLIPVLIAGIQEQQEVIEAGVREREQLQTRLREQEEQLAELRSLVDRLLTMEQEGKLEEEPRGVLQLERKAQLSQNQPNPFHQRTLVRYLVPADVRDAQIRVTSAAGTVLGTFAIAEAGEGTLTIEASTYPPGAYYYSLVLDGQVYVTKRMVLTR